jgi:hypothetical protein
MKILFLATLLVSVTIFAKVEDFPRFKCVGQDAKIGTFNATITDFFAKLDLPNGAGENPFESSSKTKQVFVGAQPGQLTSGTWLEKRNDGKWAGKYRQQGWINADLTCEKIEHSTFDLACLLPEGKIEIFAKNPTNVTADFTLQSGELVGWHVTANRIQSTYAYVKFVETDHSMELSQKDGRWTGDYSVNGVTSKITCQ